MSDAYWCVMFVWIIFGVICIREFVKDWGDYK